MTKVGVMMGTELAMEKFQTKKKAGHIINMASMAGKLMEIVICIFKILKETFIIQA